MRNRTLIKKGSPLEILASEGKSRGGLIRFGTVSAPQNKLARLFSSIGFGPLFLIYSMPATLGLGLGLGHTTYLATYLLTPFCIEISTQKDEYFYLIFRSSKPRESLLYLYMHHGQGYFLAILILIGISRTFWRGLLFFDWLGSRIVEVTSTHKRRLWHGSKRTEAISYGRPAEMVGAVESLRIEQQFCRRRRTKTSAREKGYLE